MTVEFYHEQNRRFQDRFQSRRIADRLVDVRLRDQFDEGDAALIAAAHFFLLATATPDGRPDCSYKGGNPGFVRVVSPKLLEFPDYDGNGMFKSLGNIAGNPWVALLFFETTGEKHRLRIHGRAKVCTEHPRLREYPGAQLIVEVEPEFVFPNCPRYIPTMPVAEDSEYSPREGYAPPEPLWKSKPDLAPFVGPSAPDEQQ